MVKFHLQGGEVRRWDATVRLLALIFTAYFYLQHYSALREPPQRQPAPRPPPHRPVLLADGGRVARVAVPAGVEAVALPHRRAAEWRKNSNVVVAAAFLVLDDVLEGPRRVRLPHVVRLALL